MKRIALIAALALAAGPALAGTPVSLVDGPMAGDRVTLGDLFDNAGRAAQVVVAPGPQGAASVVLDAGRVQQVARLNGLDWDNPNGFRRIVVKGGGGAAATPATTSARAGRTADALTYSRSLAAGEIIRAEDVMWTKVQGHMIPADAPGDVERVIGQAARRPLREGATVAARDLAAPRVIKRDEMIQIAYATGGVSLTLQGKALGDAGVGDSVQVLNVQSKKTIEAVAAGPGRAVVGPEADMLKSRNFAALR